MVRIFESSSNLLFKIDVELLIEEFRNAIQLSPSVGGDVPRTQTH
jgi:hypothetical protein